MRCHRLYVYALFFALGGLSACDDGAPSPAADGDDQGPPPVDAGPLDEGMAGEDGPITPPDGGLPIDMTPPDAGLAPCEPALSVDPESAFTPAYDVVTLSASGGTGQYRFALSENLSGAIVNALSGVYLAGPTVGTTDTVRVTDVGCVGETTAAVHVVLPLEIQPAEVRLVAGTSVAFDALGGSGETQYTLVLDGTGAMISAEGAYVAGLNLGQDIVRVLDPQTGVESDAFVEVVASETLVVTPGRLYTTPGDRVPVEVVGGSGHIDVVLDEAVAQLDTETRVLEGVGAGRTTIEITDHYTGIQTTLSVEVAPVLGAEMIRSGRQLNQSAVRATGDLDGDGFADVVIGFPETNIDAFSDGAVFVYAGSAEGLGSSPVQILGGSRGRDAQAGRGLAVADFDGDGQQDLAIGILNDDEAGGNAGAVHIHAGVPDGFFTEEPTLVLFPVRGGDQLGFHVEACDFNGDGLMDLAANAQRYEDRENMPNNADAGAIFVYLGTVEGLDPVSVEPVVGQDLTEEGGFAHAPQMRVGDAMTTGDFDGNGYCDLAISKVGWPTTQPGTRGAVFIYSGRGVVDDPEYPDPGGLEALPARIITGVEGQGNSGSAYGRRLAAGDLDGDGRDELLVGAHAFDLEGGDRGIVDVFAGGPLEGPVRAYTSAEDADFTFSGSNGGDQFGIAVSATDWDGDGLDDVVVGAWFDEPIEEGAETQVGAILVYRGLMGQWPDPEPAFFATGELRNGMFGEAVASVGDVDGDGVGDFVTVAARDHHHAVRGGRGVFLSGADGARGWLDFPSALSGAQFGRAAVIGDVTGDGISDLVVGAPEAGLPTDLLRAGQVFVFAGGPDGFESTASRAIHEFPGHTVDDRVGMALAMGDFDGDGHQDLAVVSHSDERGNWEADQVVEMGDCSPQNNSGSVAIFRGSPDGLAETPAFVAYGPTRDSLILRVDLADIDNDGRDDLIVGAPIDDTGGRDRGRVQVITGRDADGEGRITLACDPVFDFGGQANRANMGWVQALGDLDGDGCEEFGMGAFLADGPELPDRGLFRLVFGWGGVGCPAAPMMLVFGGGRSEQLGRSAAAGQLVGDDRPDLIVGAHNALDAANNTRPGAVFIVSGEQLAALQRQPAQPGDRRVDPLGPDTATAIYGHINGSFFGTEVGYQEGRLVVTAPRSRVGEVNRIGGARVFEFNDGTPRVVADFSIETSRYEGLMGETLALDPSRPFIAIGGYRGEGTGPENGAVYYFGLGEF